MSACQMHSISYVIVSKVDRMLIEILSPDFIFQDDRGKLVQIVHDGYKQVNVISSVCDSIRGGHYHQFNTELFYVISGSFKLIVSCGGITEDYTMNPGSCFSIPPNVVHSFEFTEETLLVSMYSNGVELESGSMDIINE